MKRKLVAPDFAETVEVLATFRFGLRRFLNFSEGIVGAAGITSQQYQALLVLIRERETGVSVGALAEEMILVPHGAVQLVNRLSEAGLAERKSDAVDARVSRVHATPKAIRLMKTLVKEHAAGLSAQERLLRKSLDSLRWLLVDKSSP
jgi:DNA-binding MarR family transcriptional regulator